MTAGELLRQADELRPNAFSVGQKLRWLRRLDAQILSELEETHEPASAAGPGEGRSALPVLEEVYSPETELLAPFPWGEELYLSWLFCQIDLHNGEIQKYNQSLSLLAAAWRSLADRVNRSRRPRTARAAFRF